MELLHNHSRNLKVYNLTDESKRDHYNFCDELICELKKYHIVEENKFLLKVKTNG